jgi:hypothetical protein
MAVWDERLSGSLITVSALVVGGFVLRRLAPIIGPGISAFALSGLQLFAEAEFEMQDGIIGELAKQTVDRLLAAVPDSGVSHAPRHAAREIIDGFEHSARARSERHGWHERDKRARYRHHVRKLKEAVAHASRDLTSEKRAYLAQASATISEDW